LLKKFKNPELDSYLTPIAYITYIKSQASRKD